MTERHLGEWWTPGKESDRSAGTLALEPFSDPKVELLGSVNGLGHSRSSNKRRAEPRPVVHGETATHGVVSLFDLREAGWHIPIGRPGGSTSFWARLAVLGGRVWLNSLDEKHIRRVRLSIPALGGPLGTLPYYGDGDHPLRLFESEDLRLQFHDSSLSWDETGTKVRWAFNQTRTIDPNHSEVSAVAEPVVEFMSTYPKSLREWLDDWIRPTQQLILLTGLESPAITKGQAWHRRHLTTEDHRGRTLTIHYDAVGPANPRPSVRPTGSIDASTLLGGASMNSTLRKVSLVESQHPLFLSALLQSLADSTTRPERNRLLDITAALEAFHASAFTEDPQRSEEHQELRAAVLAALVDQPRLRQFARRRIPKSRQPSLERRLTELMRSVDFDTRADPSPAQIARARNLVAHGELVDPRELNASVERCIGLGRAVLFNHVGLAPPVELDELTQRSA